MHNTSLYNNELNDSTRNTHICNVHYELVNKIDLLLRIVYTVNVLYLDLFQQNAFNFIHSILILVAVQLHLLKRLLLKRVTFNNLYIGD